MPTPDILTFDPKSIFIDERILLKTIGYPKAHKASAPVEQALPRLIRTARDLAVPVALHGIYNLQSVSKDGLTIAKGPSFHCSRVAGVMRGAEKALLFVLTLGKGISELSRDIAGKDPFEAFLLDAISSVMVEALADAFQDEMEERLRSRGLWGGFRYSPGYCDWPVVENRALMLFIGSDKINVTINEGGMMVPEKTISGMIGYGPVKEKMRINPCITCKKSDCDHRRPPQRPGT